MSNRLEVHQNARQAAAEPVAAMTESELVAAARELRRKVLAEMFGSLGRKLAAPRTAVESFGIPNETEVLAAATRARAEQAGHVWQWVGGLFGGLRRSIERARVASELARLDDRMLADIGLSRSDIPAILAHGTIDRSGRMSPAEAAANDVHEDVQHKAAA
jgi:uncharacterized protein YjiS (DUF1127 family)